MSALVAVLLALAQQDAGLPTVGDTIWVRRAVAAPAGATVRPPDWSPQGDVELLGPPVLDRVGDSVVIRFPLVAWTAGRKAVAVPGASVLLRDGAVETMPPMQARFSVRSVLPDEPVAGIAPQPAAGVVARGTANMLPLFLLGALALLMLGPLHWWWRRRGEALPRAPTPAAEVVPVDRWAAAGEARSVLADAAARLRGAIAARVPDAHRGLDTDGVVAVLGSSPDDLPVPELAAVLRRLDAARFAPPSPADVEALHADAVALAGRVAGAEP